MKMELPLVSAAGALQMINNWTFLAACVCFLSLYLSVSRSECTHLSLRPHSENARDRPKRLKAASTHPHIRKIVVEKHVHCICEKSDSELRISTYYNWIYYTHWFWPLRCCILLYCTPACILKYISNVYLYCSCLETYLSSLSAPRHISYYLQLSAYLSFSISH